MLNQDLSVFFPLVRTILPKLHGLLEACSYLFLTQDETSTSYNGVLYSIFILYVILYEIPFSIPIWSLSVLVELFVISWNKRHAFTSFVLYKSITSKVYIWTQYKYIFWEYVVLTISETLQWESLYREPHMIQGVTSKVRKNSGVDKLFQFAQNLTLCNQPLLNAFWIIKLTSFFIFTVTVYSLHVILNLLHHGHHFYVHTMHTG